MNVAPYPTPNDRSAPKTTFQAAEFTQEIASTALVLGWVFVQSAPPLSAEGVKDHMHQAKRVLLVAALTFFQAASSGCGEGTTNFGGGTGGGAGGAAGGGAGGAGGGGGGGGATNPCPDLDGDGTSSCAADCNDNDPTIHPGATETSNGKDDDCDGKVDNHIANSDFDKDGTPYPADCNDDEALVGPAAIEDPTNKVDDNCNGQVDEAAPDCEGLIAGTTPADFGRAINLCAFVSGSAFPTGNASSRGIRAKFGDQWTPRHGAKMILLSSGEAKDNYDDASYSPQPGREFLTAQTHPLWQAPRCAAPSSAPQAEDLSEVKLTLKVPQNAKAISFQFNFFSAEYPEWVCTEFNDRFIAILESTGLDTTKLPQGQCVPGAATPTCNVSYDDKGQVVSINNGFFDVCDSASGTSGGQPWSNTCTKPSSMLAKTGYEKKDASNRTIGGATGWLTTKAPVKPGETINLRFIILDEGDARLDSAVLIDNFKWEFTSVAAPVTEPGLN